MKKCVACAEEIQSEAQLCKHCKTFQSDTRFSDESQTSEPTKGGQGPALGSVSAAPKKLSFEPNSFGSFEPKQSNKTLISISVIVGLIFLAVLVSLIGSGSGSGGGSTQSEMYRLGYQTAQGWGQKMAEQSNSYYFCNDLANSFYTSNGQVNTAEEMDEWLQGCLAYVRN